MARVFYELPEAGHDSGAGEEFTENFDLAAKFLVRDGLYEFFGGGAGGGVKFRNLSGRGAGDLEGLAFGGQLSDEAHGLRSRCVHAAAGEQQISYEAVAKIALEARYPAKTGDEAQAEFGKGEASHLVRDDDVGNKRQLKSSSETDAVNGGDGDERRLVQPVENGVNVFEKIANAFRAQSGLKLRGTVIELAQVGSGAEPAFLRAGDDASRCFRGQLLRRLDKFLQLAEHHGANLIGRRTIKRKFDNAVAPFPTESLAAEGFHAVAFRAYIDWIS